MSKDTRVHLNRRGGRLSWMFVTLTAVCVFTGAAACGASADSPTLADASAAEDGGELILTPHDPGAAPRTLTLEDWRNWARERLDDALGEPVRIGEFTQGPDEFGWIATAALDPAGRRVAFPVSAYAVATTASLVHVLDAETMDIAVVPEPIYGDIAEMRWAPRGGFVAYAAGTARAAGEYLRVDDTDEMTRAFVLNGADIGRALEEERGEGETGLGGPDPSEFLPHFRDVSWENDGDWLEFTTNKRSPDHRPVEERETASWRVRPDGTGLERTG